MKRLFFILIFGCLNVALAQSDVFETDGKGNRDIEIAYDMCLSVPTVRKHLQSIYLKVGVNSKYELVCKLKID